MITAARYRLIPLIELLNIAPPMATTTPTGLRGHRGLQRVAGFIRPTGTGRFNSIGLVYEDERAAACAEIGDVFSSVRRAPVHAKIDCYVAQIVDTYRGAECY